MENVQKPSLAGRRIAHLDMDAFYASVELQRFPELKGLPVVIGGRRAKAADLAEGKHDFERLGAYVGRGVVTTATYEARAFGVHSGLGLMKAAALAPDAILLPGDFESYGLYSRRFKAAVAAIAPRYEDRGIDEIYLDLTEVPGETVELAQRIKEAVRAATGLSFVHRHRPQQAAGEGRLGAAEARWPDPAHGWGCAHAHLAPARRDPQRHRSQGQRQARSLRHPHHR